MSHKNRKLPIWTMKPGETLILPRKPQELTSVLANARKHGLGFSTQSIFKTTESGERVFVATEIRRTK